MFQLRKACINIKLVQAFVCPFPRIRGKVEKRETGMANFIIRGGIIAMPVSVAEKRCIIPEYIQFFLIIVAVWRARIH
ncbi:MAG: hypothetical protein A2342_05595 [Gallionellales bacterium RIFOXYB12_FULL_54_9]|nr:MAG: hypothetical protein A2342_05595 [Gallionellales bacterium RIFOXYB12_FULL_54_9]